jgi:Ala-tRNA(Pro) deacylase
MTIASSIIDYLNKSQVSYSVIAHAHSATSKQTVSNAHISPDKLAKAVILKDAKGYVMAVIPADKYVSLQSVAKRFGRTMVIATESGFPQIFKDCEPGAIPPIGPAYGMETLLDDSLVGQPDIYFEAGDHEELIHMNGENFLLLLKRAHHGRFCE